jgi:hypothetical protein
MMLMCCRNRVPLGDGLKGLSNRSALEVRGREQRVERFWERQGDQNLFGCCLAQQHHLLMTFAVPLTPLIIDLGCDTSGPWPRILFTF